jgi:hypothetical protein
MENGKGEKERAKEGEGGGEEGRKQKISKARGRAI